MQDYEVNICGTLIHETIEAPNAIEALEFVLVENPLPTKGRQYIAKVSSGQGYTISLTVSAK